MQRELHLVVSFRLNTMMGGSSVTGDIDATKVQLSSPIYERRGRKAGGSCCSIMWAMAEALSVVELEGRWDGGMEIPIGVVP
jgi:hypothetical protein